VGDDDGLRVSGKDSMDNKSDWEREPQVLQVPQVFATELGVEQVKREKRRDWQEKEPMCTPQWLYKAWEPYTVKEPPS